MTGSHPNDRSPQWPVMTPASVKNPYFSWPFQIFIRFFSTTIPWGTFPVLFWKRRRAELLEILDNILLKYDIFDPILTNAILSAFRLELNDNLGDSDSITNVLPNIIKYVLMDFGYQYDYYFIENLIVSK